MRLLGKTAVVTGGAAGIGKGIALCLAEEGANVVVADVDETAASETAARIEALGRRAQAVSVDVTRMDQVEAMVAKAREFARIDVLVNNAGVEYITPLFDVSESEWDKTLAVNLKGMFLCCQAVARAMADDGRGGKIVNVGSIAGIKPPRRAAHYGVSKSGVHMLTRELALELAEHRINVNAVAPGSIRNGTSSRHSLADPENAERVRLRIPWRRIGTPADIGKAVVFLASGEADYITGAILVVDGGVSLI